MKNAPLVCPECGEEKRWICSDHPETPRFKEPIVRSVIPCLKTLAEKVPCRKESLLQDAGIAEICSEKDRKAGKGPGKRGGSRCRGNSREILGHSEERGRCG